GLEAGAYQVGGADVVTYEEMMNQYAALTGRRRVVIKVPVLAPGLSARAISLATEHSFRVPGLPAPWLSVLAGHSLPVALRLASGLSVETVVTDRRMQELVDIQPMTFDAALRTALGPCQPSGAGCR
nr:hypothetical protein [Actinomycetota bacterium]